ncbi:MAG TPA: hypothetical protein VGH38_02895 [Bryobacteraceae bacterium]
MKIPALLLGCAALALAASNPSVFQIRSASDIPSADSEQMTYKSKDGQTIPLYVQKEPLLDISAVHSAEMVRDVAGSPFNVKITFTPEGRERFAEATRQNVRKRIAVIIDGRVYAAPMIQSELTAPSITISGDIGTEQQATELAAKIQKAVDTK